MLHLFCKVSAVCGYFIIMENILYGELVGLLGTEHWPGWGDSHIKVMGGGCIRGDKILGFVLHTCTSSCKMATVVLEFV